MVIVFIVLAAVVGGGVYFAQDRIRGWIDSAEGVVRDAGDAFKPGVATPREKVLPAPGYRGVRGLVRELNAKGLDCRQTVVDAENEYISTGSCQAHVKGASFPVHVQINIYLDPDSLIAALDIMKESPFDYVTADNWVVVTQPQVARLVKRAIGGRIRLAS
ncbi:MAG: hypothetical protein QOG54_2607 [Actinomycetota bacterium]|jgi:hypothetical protein|nr:hypothetical protein [Actinomycetota bacterium]